MKFDNLMFQNDWKNILRPQDYNWVDFKFIYLAFRWDKLFGKFDCDVGLLGFSFYGSLVYDDQTPTRLEIDAMVDEWDAKNEENDA